MPTTAATLPRRHATALVLGLLLATGAGGCATAPRVFASPESIAEATSKFIPESQYRIAVGDVVKFVFDGEGGVPIEPKVDASGCVVLPLIGKQAVAGLTVGEAQAALGKAYANVSGHVEPQITIVIKSLASHEVSIVGQIDKPGRYLPSVAASVTVHDLLMVGGLNRRSLLFNVRLIRTASDGRQDTKKIDFLHKTDGKLKDANADLPLQPGDTVFVDECLCLP